MNRSYFYILIFVGMSIQAQLSTKHKQLIGKDSTHLQSVKGHFLTTDAANAYVKMKSAALKDSINIMLVSAYRSYNHQKNIWNRKYNRYQQKGYTTNEIFDKITDYSTFPGTSRHHWGTEIDIIENTNNRPTSNVLNEKHFTRGGAFYNMYQWLEENAHRFGFYETYTNEPSRKGFKFEPWHYSYRPESKENLRIYIESNLYEHCLKLPVSGISQVKRQIKDSYFKEQLMDINPDLRVKNK